MKKKVICAAVVGIICIAVNIITYFQDSDMGLSQEVIENPKSRNAEETVRLFYYYWNKDEYEPLLDLIQDNCSFYGTMKQLQYFYAEDDKENDLDYNIKMHIKVYSISREEHSNDEIMRYRAKWKGRISLDEVRRDETYFDLKKIDGEWKIIESGLYV